MLRTALPLVFGSLLSATAFATEVEIPYGAYVDLETGNWSTESDCFAGLVDCRPMDMRVRQSEKHAPATFLEFPRSVGQARTDKAPAEVDLATLTELAAYRYDSAFGFLPETLVVTKGTRTFAIQLVSEGADKATLRFEYVATQTASN